jgi:hypothetical protein
MKAGAPIRFLVLMLGGWTLLRVSMLAPGWWSGVATIAALPAEPPEPSEPRARPSDMLAGIAAGLGDPETITRWAAAPLFSRPSEPLTSREGRLPLSRSSAAPTVAYSSVGPAAQPTSPPPGSSVAARPVDAIFVPAQPPPGASPAPRAPLPARRWSGSAWLLARGNGGAALAPGGTLGGSQAGARLLYRLGGDAARPLSLSGRVYMPLRRTRGAEAALGLDWRPSAAVPIHLLIERRQRLGREGRSAFSFTAHGGSSADLGRGWRLDGYAQAGIVGTRSRDAFVDGSARVSRPFGPIEAGAAVWGAAQPGAARLDAGPHVTLPIRTRGTALRLSAEYRFRITGDARPASGPALTLGVDS